MNTGAAVYEYQQVESIHGKSLILDDRISAVGSFNLDERSAYIDTETMLVIDSPELVKQMKDAIANIMEKSLEVGRDNTYISTATVAELKATVGKKSLMGVVYLLLRPFQLFI